MPGLKVYELAKELNMSSKDMLDKINSMGIDAKSHMSVLSEMDVLVVRNTILHARDNAETKIVKVAPKKTDTKPVKEEVKVVVKAATHPSISPESKLARPAAKPAQPQRPPHPPAQGQPAQRQASQPHSAQPHTAPQTGKATQAAAPQKPAQAQPQRAVQNIPQHKTPSEGHPGGQTPPQTSQAAHPAQPQKPAQSVQPERQQKPAQSAQPAAQKPVQGVQSVQPQRAAQEAKPAQPQKPAQAAQHAHQKQAHSPQQGQQRKPGQGQQAQQQRPARAFDDKAAAIPAKAPERREKPSGKQYQEKDKEKEKEKELKPNLKQQQKYMPKQIDESKPAGAKGSKPVSLEKQQKTKHHQKPAPKQAEPEIDLSELPPGTKVINVPITVAGFAEQIGKSASQVILTLMKLGIMANINQNIDEDTVLILGDELGVNVVVGKIEEDVVEEGLELFEDKEEDLRSRPPIITVMGHVDHGKTSLLDTIRKTNVTASESGGITQHIGASEVYYNGQKIVFLDTPGHEAFTAMRARGAHVTDIAVLVVAADDGVMPQTVEAISHAKAAGVPIIVAINKIDKPGVDPTRVKQELTEHGILVEEWGGDTICVHVSAKTGEGIDTLLEMILLQAEMLELKANPNRLAMGTVIEARLDKNKGPVATLLVLNGTLQTGMSVVAGTCSGRIKAMTNYKGDAIKKAGPATPVEILGLDDVPEAGDEFNAVREERIAREIAEHRRIKLREETLAKTTTVTLEQFFSQIKEGEVKELNLIVKGDVQGSVEALTQSLEKLTNENVRVKIVHAAVGTVTESDVMLANTAGAIIIAFNVRPSSTVTSMAERENVEIRTYRVIYDVIDEVEAALKGMLEPVFKEVVLGKLEIRETFKVPGVGIIGGAYVLEGKVQRNASIRLVRDGIVVHEGKISSLKRFKDDVKEVAHGYECGIGIENYNDIKVGDIIEAYKMEETERK